MINLDILRRHGGGGVTATILLLLILCNHTNAGNRPSYLNQANQFLAPQNAVRSALGMKPLVWDTRLARYAALYANQRRGDCNLKHSNGPFGENIFWGSGNGWNPAHAVTDWISERKWYNRWTDSCTWGHECGHYTQIVWRRTKKVGCAKVICFGGKGVFMTCNYDPPGNYIGEKPY